MIQSRLQQQLRRGRFIRYAPLILWVAVIFTASSTAGASQHTSMVIRPLLEWLFPAAPPAALDVYHGYIRKLAHFTEYALLAFFAARAFRYSSREFFRKNWFGLAFAAVLAIASLDEYGQSLNPTRTGSVYDVLIDAAGGLAMLTLLAVRNARRRRPDAPPRPPAAG